MTRWQNLAEGKCPKCENEKLERDGKVYACNKCDYYITPDKLVEWLTDQKSKTRKYMEPEQLKKVANIMDEKTK